MSETTVPGPPQPAGSAPQSWRPGTWIEGWQLEEVLGRGGMGVVYRARDTQGRAVALKTLARSADAHARERFRREGVAQARVDGHPNVVRVHAAGEHLGQPYLVQEEVSGGSLGERLSQGPLRPAEACELVAALARGVAHLHAQGILHRDIKPTNVLFDGARGTPKLCDFGLAQLADAESLTRTGQTLGTVAYMAPEQVDAAKHADARTDVYGLGALLFACVAGRPPRVSEGSAVNVLYELLSRPAPRLRSVKPDAPAGLDELCARALASEPRERFASALELAEALEDPALLTPHQRGRSRGLLLATGLAACALVGAGVFLRASPPEGPAASPSPSRRISRARSAATPAPGWRISAGQTLVYRVTWEEQSYSKVHDVSDSLLILRFSEGSGPDQLRFAAEWRFASVRFPAEVLIQIQAEALARSHGKTALVASLDPRSGALTLLQGPQQVFEQVRPQRATAADIDPRGRPSAEGLEFSWASGAFATTALQRALELLFAREVYPAGLKFRWTPGRNGYETPAERETPERALTPLHWNQPYEGGQALEGRYTLQGTRRRVDGLPARLELRQEADFGGRYQAFDEIVFELKRD